VPAQPGVVNPQRLPDEVSLTSRGPVVATYWIMLRVIFGIMLMIAIFGILRPLLVRDDVETDCDATTLFESNEALAPLTF
jgi:hypothetical protein